MFEILITLSIQTYSHCFTSISTSAFFFFCYYYAWWMFHPHLKVSSTLVLRTVTAITPSLQRDAFLRTVVVYSDYSSPHCLYRAGHNWLYYSLMKGINVGRSDSIERKPRFVFLRWWIEFFFTDCISLTKNMWTY